MRVIQSLVVWCCFMLLFFTFIPVSHAEDSQTYEVGTQVLNVRDAPTKNAEIVGQLREGDKLVSFQEEFGWVQTYYGGQEVWVASHYLVPSEASSNNREQESLGGITVTGKSVNIRSGPGTDFSIIGSSSAGVTYNLVETSNGWHKISSEEGLVGWMAAWLTDQPAINKVKSDGPPPEKEQSKEQSTGVLDGYNIVIDPGHGGIDPGAIGFNGVFEKDLINATTEKVEQQLRDAGATVILTRAGDYFIPLEERIRISSVYNTHAFVSIHYNAFPVLAVHGIGTYYYTGNSNRKLAREIQSALVQHVDLHDRGVNQAEYKVLRKNNDLAVLVELGFITNPTELATIQTADYQSKVATAITNGLQNYFNNEY